MKLFRKIHSKMAVNMIAVVVCSLLLLGLIVSMFGLMSFTEVFKNEYADSTYHMADTATTLVNGDHLEAYLAGKESAEYLRTKDDLDQYCKSIAVSLIYVIQVDRSDFGRFVSIFNAVDNSIDNTSYSVWEIGHKRDTTNEEYRQKYRAIYEQQSPYETVYRTHPTDGQNPHITTLVPVKNSAKQVVAILCMQRPIREMADAIRAYVIQTVASTVAVSILAVLCTSAYFRKQIASPIRKVSKEATRFAKENTKGKELGAISHFEEIANLASSIDKMETNMVNYMENLTAATAERERISTELYFARDIQANSIPNVFPAFPERSDFDIYASMTPAKAVGGDFYNFFLTDDDHLAFVIGDVSGKGIPGALFMMATNIVITERTKTGGTPAEILTYANASICEGNKADMFITLWLGILELSTGRIIAANAGHEDAAVYRKDGTFKLFKTKHGIPVGAMEGFGYEDFELKLGKGDKLFLYTDGVPEATDTENNMFRLSRMLETLNANKEKSPEEILNAMQRSVDAFVGEALPFDDLTMLCLELKDGPAEET